MQRVLSFFLFIFLLVVPAYALDEEVVSTDIVEDSQSAEDDSGLPLGYSDGVPVPVYLADSPVLYDVLTSPVDGGIYMDVSSSIGDLTIYVPSDYQRASFSYYGSGGVTSIRASTISGYGFKGSTMYQIRFPPFSNPEYRVYDSGYSYSDFSINSVTSTNIQIASSNDDFPLYPDQQLLQLSLVTILGVLLLWLFMRR